MQELLNLIFAVALVALYLGNRSLKKEVEELRRYTTHLLRQDQRRQETVTSHRPDEQHSQLGTAATGEPQPASFSEPAPQTKTEPLKPSAAFPTFEQLVAASAQKAADPAFLRSDRKKRNAELEQFIGGNLLNKVGVLALLITAGLFLSYAFEHDLISETMRCVVGFVVGFGCLGAAEMSRRRSLPVFSQALVALGVSVLYLTVYAMFQFYSLVPQWTAMVLMALVCLLTVGLALYYGSEAVALMAAIGAYLTPVLLGDPSADALPLLAYLLLVAMALTFLIRAKPDWLWLRVAPPVGSWFLLLVWYFENDVQNIALEAAFCYALWMLFLFYDLMHRVLEPERGRWMDPVVTGMNALLVISVTIFITDEASEVWQSVPAGTAALIYLALALSVHQKMAKSTIVLKIWLVMFAFMAMGSVFVVLDGYDGATLVAFVTLGFFGAARYVGLQPVSAAMGTLLISNSLVLMVLGTDTPEPDWFIVNLRTLAYLLVIAGWLTAGLNVAEAPKRIVTSRTFAGVAAVLMGFLWLNFEMEAAFDRWMPYSYDSPDQNRYEWIELSRSGLWMLYSLLLFAVGIMRKAAAPRYAAIVLLGVTILKIFFSDLGFLDTPYRIASFFALGLILLLVSFVYQRYRHVIFPEMADAETKPQAGRIP